MDKATAKLIIESYRAEDANDPIFAEALKAVADDPELAAWFEQMQRFDAVMSTKFKEMHVSPDVRSDILLGRGASSKIIPLQRWRLPVALSSIAAMLFVGLFSWHLLAPEAGRMNQVELQAVAYSDKMPPLQFVCFNAAAVADWINKQPGSARVGLQLPPPPQSLSMAMIGSSMIHWNGHPVVMVCLQNEKQMALLYILKASDFPELKNGASETVQNANWVVRSTRSNDQVRLLATKGGPEDLAFQTPF